MITHRQKVDMNDYRFDNIKHVFTLLQICLTVNIFPDKVYGILTVTFVHVLSQRFILRRYSQF